MVCRMIVTSREQYYSQPYVLYNLIPQLRYKYLSCRKVPKSKKKAVLTRYYLGYSIQLLQQSLQKLGVLKDQSTKIYFDLSYWKDEKGNTPLFDFDSKKRKEDKKRFNEEFNKCFVGYDFAIDIDSESINKAHRDTQKIKNLLDEYKLPYSLKFSGGRGFHFLIEDKWFNPKMKAKNKVVLFGNMARVIMHTCGLKSHDKGGTFDDSIYDDRRIFKLAYSLQYKNNKEYVCLPLSDEQFEGFKLEHMELMNVMNPRYCKLYKRGLLTRDYGLIEKELKDNVKRFVKQFRKNG